MRIRLSVRRLMILVAVLAPCLAAFRLSISLGSFMAGVLTLTLLRIFEVTDRCRDLGTPLLWWRRVTLILWSLGIATVILTVSSVVCVVVFDMAGGGYAINWRHGG